MDGLLEFQLLDLLSIVNIIQLVVSSLIKRKITNSNHLFPTRHPDTIDVSRAIPDEITNMSARLQLLELWNIVD